MGRNIKFSNKGPSVDNTADENSNCCISFEYMTKNKDYNYEHFKKDMRGGFIALKALAELIHNISVKTHKELKDLGKIEKEDLNNFKGPIYDILKQCAIIPPNSTEVLIIRFGGKKYRAVVKWDPIKRSLLHILAFDFDFSLYDHGS